MTENHHRQPDIASRILFGTGLLLFAAMAVSGWIKLRYGFSFSDEGMYMTDGWRMAMGDRLFPDNATNVIRLYVLFNALVFKLHPGITLLGFRELQWCMTLGALGLLGLAIYRWTRVYWYLPWVLSLFAFTGMDALGIISNLSYYTYPHFFLMLHVSLMLFGLTSENRTTRRIWFAGAGVGLWGIGFSTLPLSPVAAAPVLLWLAARRAPRCGIRYATGELGWTLAPVAVLWLGFIALYHAVFIDALRTMFTYQSWKLEQAGWINLRAVPYLAICAALLGLFALAARRTDRWLAVAAVGLAAVAWWLTHTNAGGIILPYRVPWYTAQSWFAGLLSAGMLFGLAWPLVHLWRKEALDRHQALLLIILFPNALAALLFARFSGLGLLAVLELSAPAGLAVVVLVAGGGHLRPQWRQAVIIVALLLPFYHGVALGDWRYTFFDLAPRQLTDTFPDGFAKGIHTNPISFAAARWIDGQARKYTGPGDRAIFYDYAPMGYMLTGLRPSLNHSWTGLARSLALKRDAVEQMQRDGMEPVIAFRFVNKMLIKPMSIADGIYLPPEFRNFLAADPVDRYVRERMERVETFRVQGRVWIECYVAGKQGPHGVK